MIYNHVTYQRDFFQEFPSQERVPEESNWQSKVFSALSLASLHKTLRGPLGAGLSSLRSISYISNSASLFKQGNIAEGSFHLMQSSLSAASVGLFFFNPVYGMLTSTLGDGILHFRAFIEAILSGDAQSAMEMGSLLSLDLLFATTICYASLEATVACMLLQVAVDVYFCIRQLKKGNLFEAACQAILAGAKLHQAIPQMKFLQWKWEHQPQLQAELKRNERGFVYLDIPDEMVPTLLEVLGDSSLELPPYFGGKDAVGAHVSVLVGKEQNVDISQHIGKQISFSFSHLSRVNPDGWKGVEEVAFLALSCPELEAIRSEAGLTPKIAGTHDFHITFGLQRE